MFRLTKLIFLISLSVIDILMIQKLFPLDKNYILKEAQLITKQSLLETLVKEVKKCYLFQCNPLGLVDDTVLKITRTDEYSLLLLEDFYEHLAGIYRFKFGANQLEFLFDGRTHFEKYQEDWTAAFIQWVALFCKEENFLKAVLEATILFLKIEKRTCRCPAKDLHYNTVRIKGL